MLMQLSPFPDGLKPGDFVQTTGHFGDIFFEVKSVIAPVEGSDFWMVTYWTYGKYASRPGTATVSCPGGIRRVVPAELAEPVMREKRLRFHASHGQYDPCYGYAPLGTPLRQREAA